MCQKIYAAKAKSGAVFNIGSCVSFLRHSENVWTFNLYDPQPQSQARTLDTCRL